MVKARRPSSFSSIVSHISTMARYLTPAKIGLLALIELYVEETVPNDAIIPVLSFLTSHILDSDLQSTMTTTPGAANRWQRAERSIGLVVSIKDFEDLLLPFPAVDRLPGRRLWTGFWRSCGATILSIIANILLPSATSVDAN
nr:unnamed protein product [Mus musculus]